MILSLLCQKNLDLRNILKKNYLEYFLRSSKKKLLSNSHLTILRSFTRKLKKTLSEPNLVVCSQKHQTQLILSRSNKHIGLSRRPKTQHYKKVLYSTDTCFGGCNDSKHNDTQHTDTHHNDTQHNDTQHNNTQHCNTQHTVIMLSIAML